MKDAMCSCSLFWLLLVAGLATITGLTLLVATACMSSVDCGHSLPTISHAARFEHHDRVFLFLTTGFGCAHIWIYLAMNSLLSELRTREALCTQAVGLANVPLLVLLTLVDHNVSVEFHVALAMAFLGTEVIYVFSCKLYLLPLHPEYERFRLALRSTLWLDLALGGVVVLALLAYELNSRPTSKPIHATLRALTEYLLVIGGVLYPAFMARLFPGARVALLPAP